MSYHKVVDSSPARNPRFSRNFIALVITQTCFGLSFLRSRARGRASTSCFFFPLARPRARFDLLPMFMRLSLAASACALLVGGTVTTRFGYPVLFVVSALLTVGAALRLWQRPLALDQAS